MELVPAVERARLFVRLALHDAPGLGAGHGPMGHQFVREDAMVDGPSLNQVTVGCRDYAASVGFLQGARACNRSSIAHPTAMRGLRCPMA